ncbi:MAG TPA: signal peptide peptidase SppA, partial [Sphingomonadaceae bacterium]|nr:signal peptide peptidase SppA [Sphingomonadaceae bacterium]
MRLLRGFWALLVGIKDLLVLIFMLLFFAGLYAALSLSPTPKAAGGGALVVDLDGSLVEQPAPVDAWRALAGGPTPVGREYRLRDVVRAIEGAAGDDSIKAVVLDLDSFIGGGQTAIEAAARAVDKVRQAGKPVLAFATGYTDGGYLLAAHASEVWLDPQGAVLLAGRGGNQLYYKGLLDKLGVTVKVYRVGRFKSAVEPFIRTGQSDEARKANQALADSLWQSWRADVQRARPAARLASYIDAPAAAIAGAGGDTARAAAMAGLVDRIGDRIAFGKRIAQIAGADRRQPGAYRAVPLESWLASHPETRSGSLIGVLTVAGTIVDGQAQAGTAGGDTIARLLLDELGKGRIKALVVRIDSPGGSVTASERIRSAILEAKARGLPVVVSMGSVAASGGYWVATAGDMLFAQPSTITGSIGVFGMIPTFQGTLAKLGLSADGVGTTPLSGQPDVYHGTSETFDSLIQTGIDSIYRRFTGLVAASRHLPVARVDEIG